MYIKEIWRYPVKSMKGEALQSARLTELGIEGDRVLKVLDRAGRVITSRTHPKLLGLDGRAPVQDLTEAIQGIVGPGARLVRDESADRFDILPLLVATDGAIEAFGRDGRRLRPNIVIGGVEGLAERDWPGRSLRIGGAVVGLDSLRGRCVMTTFDPDTLKQDPGVLRDIVRRFDGKLALNAWVEHPGTIHLDQQIEIF